MSGHSKWSTIKHKKAKVDAQKGKAFTKVVREIVIAAKQGGGDADMNPALRLALQKAKAANMPKDNVERAIAKGVGGGDDSNFEEVVYEAYGPGGVAILIYALTDNRNRTGPNMRMILDKNGGNLANPGAVSYLFDPMGVILFEPGVDADLVMECAIDAGAEDVDLGDDGSVEVKVSPEGYEAVLAAIDAAGLVYLDASVSKLPQTTVDLDLDGAKQIVKLLEFLEEDDDVQDVYSNYSASDEVMAEVMG